MVALLLLVLSIGLLVAPLKASGAVLTAQTITPSSTAAGAAGINYSFFGTGLTASTVDRVVVTWPAAVTKGTIVASDITTLSYGASAATGIAILSQAATTVTITHTTLTPTAGSAFNLTIAGNRFTNPATSGVYQWTLQTRSGGTSRDSLSPLSNIGTTTASVGANIANSLTFTYTNVPIAVDVIPGGVAVAQSATLTASTNNSTGFTVQASTPGVTRVGGGGTINTNTAFLSSTGTAFGTPAVGALLWGVSRASAVSNGCGAGGTPVCSATTFWGIPVAASTLAQKTMFQSNTNVASGSMTLSYQFRANGTALPGDYSGTVTYSAAPN